MLTFCGSDIELVVEEVLERQDGPVLCRARDFEGGRWLIGQVDDDPAHLAWICVPISDRAMQAVVTGRSAVGDVLRHSATGTVELVTIDDGRAVPDQCLLCATLPEPLLTIPRRNVAAAACGRQPSDPGNSRC